MHFDLSHCPSLSVDHDLLNRVFWCTLFLGIVYYLLSRLIERCNQRLRRQAEKAVGGFQARFIWNVCFYLASSAFFVCYHWYFVEQDLNRENNGGRYFPQQHNHHLFYVSAEANRSNFKNIFVVSFAYHLLATVEQLREAEYTDAVTRTLFTGVLASLYGSGFEHYFILLHVTIGLHQALTNCLLMVAHHVSLGNKQSGMLINACAVIHFISWSYVFLSLLPFNYLLPTLYMKDVPLNVLCFAWYGACVWNSPILKLLYHQTFHGADFGVGEDCLGGGNAAQCLLLRDSKERKSLRQLKKSVELLRASEMQSSSRRSHHSEGSSGAGTSAGGGTENHSARALQTLKCVMTLKRKLKRMRENKAVAGEGASN